MVYLLPSEVHDAFTYTWPALSRFCDAAGNLMVVALADVEGLQKVAYFTLKNLYQPGDTIHTTYVEDAASAGMHPAFLVISVLASATRSVIALS